MMQHIKKVRLNSNAAICKCQTERKKVERSTTRVSIEANKVEVENEEAKQAIAGLHSLFVK
jgi:hypothetical protein